VDKDQRTHIEGEKRQMSHTNICVIQGNLARDAELKYTQSGTAMLKGTIANNRVRGSGENRREHTNWIRFTMWGKRAESIAQYFTKGTPLVLEGEWETGKYEKDGQTRYTNDFVVNDFSFAGKKRDSDGDSSGGYSENISDGPHSNNVNDGDFEGDIPF
jgi:single-strand DNA-binding protein